MRRAGVLAIGAGACVTVLSACERPERARADAAAETGVAHVDEPARSGEGCARAGAVEAAERDPTCFVEHPDARASPSALRWLTMSARFDAPAVVPGGTTNLRVTIANSAARATVIVLEARPPAAAGRPDWARLSGLSAPQAAPSGDTYRAWFAVRTLDARELPVDRLPTLPPAADSPVRYLRIRLAPGASLTWSTPWWALGIPAPYPPFKDDAGRRIVPQTAPRPLSPGEYTVTIEVPLYNVGGAEREVRATVRVAVEGGP
jgi:hypothetical protein